ncbi:MAG TPA: cytochrome b5 domain-containing protein [Candidatus Limnocylindrales bacterium]|nr:cytochrome b5 domain-containing protein [Candidatus Limnocylindrales bacterium]
MSQDKARKFTSEDLKQFNGENGQPLYVVFKGKVYDFSSSQLWSGGKHMGTHDSSEDLAEAIKTAPHGEDNVYRFPVVGELSEVAPLAPPTPLMEKKPVEPQVQPAQPSPPMMERRTFLKLAAAAGGAVTIAALLSTLKAGTYVPPPTVVAAWPIVTVANVKSLTNLTPIVFYYPLTNTPNYLVKLGVPATGGIGPNNDIVAFSAICQHLGCIYGFVAPGGSPPCNSSFKAVVPMGYCCCHGSQYNFLEAAKVIGGPAPRSVPMVKLQFDSSTGNITAVGMNPPTIYGYGPPGTTNPKLVMEYDLQAGNLVTQSTVLG